MKRTLTAFLLAASAAPAEPQAAQPAAGTGSIRGTAVLDTSGNPVHHARIVVARPRREVETDDDGNFQITGLPAGTYDVTAHMHDFADASQAVTVAAGETTTVHFRLRLAVVKQTVTVTATGTEQSTFESIQTVASVGTLELAQKTETSLGEVLNNQPGVAKRSFGPGPSRPVIRGFDGDRVLVMQDGVSTGTLSSQSGDHGETIDPSSLERIEVVKGPATLLYGSNAMGGVVNAISGHHQLHPDPHDGLRGYLTTIGGSANGHSGASAGFEYGYKNWLVWGGGGGQRTGDYATPIGRIANSGTRVATGSVGVGKYADKVYFDIGYQQDSGRYGVPFAGEIEAGGTEGEAARINLETERHNLRFNTGYRNLNSFAPAFRLTLNYSDYRHTELENDEAGTVFRNKQFSYRGIFEQRAVGRLTGSFGFSGAARKYKATGAETLSPPVTQDNIAVFALEELGLERLKLQFGARVENNRYSPDGLRDRSFTGFSGGAGVHVPLWKGGALVGNYTHSYRTPALEELYNNGPHVGTLTFEIGDPGLTSERANGYEVALRHQSGRVRGELNAFRYDIADFVYLAPTGASEEGLLVARYSQGDSRFAGTEAGLDVGLRDTLWLNLGLDYVNAELKRTSTPLPRIPPLRGRMGVEYRYKNLSVKPQLLLTNAQNRIFPTETRTAGFVLGEIAATYTLARQHLVHVFSLTAFNLGDVLYRNHLSFIKDRAPEIGCGFKFTYTVRFF